MNPVELVSCLLKVSALLRSLCAPVACYAAEDQDVEESFLYESLSDWADDLDDVDERTREVAAWALGQMGENAAPHLSKLLQCLSDDDPAVRRAAAIAIAQIAPNHPDTYPVLRQLVLDESSVSSIAIRALSADDRVATIRHELTDQSPETRASAALALKALKATDESVVAALVEALQDSESFDAQDRYVQQGRHKWVAISAADALSTLGIPSHEADVALIKALEDEDERLRAAAAEALGKRRCRAAVPVLAKMIQDSDELVARAAVESLGELGSDASEAIPLLIAGFTRIGFLPIEESLTKIGEPAVEPLKHSLADSKRVIRWKSADTLAKMQQVAAPTVPQLVLLLRDSDDTVRRQAISALGEIGVVTDDVTSALLWSLEDDSTVVSAAQALGKLAPSDSRVPVALQKVLMERDQQARVAAVSALGQYTRIDSVVQSLVTALSDHADWQVRATVAHVLVNARDVSDAVIPALIQALDDESAHVAYGASQSLAGCGIAAEPAVEVLLDRLQSNDKVASGAAIAVATLAPRDPRVAKALADAISNPDEIVRNSAIVALTRMDRPAEEIVPVVVDALDDPSTAVSWEAARALGKYGAVTPDVVPALIRSLNDIDIAEVSLKSLAQIGPDAKLAVPRLVALARRGLYRNTIVEVLNAIGPVSDQEFTQLQVALEEIESPLPMTPESYPQLVVQSGSSQQMSANSLYVAADRSRAIFADSAKTPLLLWDVTTGLQIKRLSTQDYARPRILDGHGTRALLDHAESRVSVWDLATDESIQEYEFEGVLSAAVFTDDAECLLFAIDRTATLWHIEKDRVLMRLIHPANIRSVAISHNSKTAVTLDERIAIMWEVASGNELWRIQARTSFHAAGYSSNGRLIAFADDKDLIVLDATHGMEIARLEGHSASVRRLLFSPDNLQLLSQDSENKVILWDLASHSQKSQAVGSDIAFGLAGPCTFQVSPVSNSIAVIDVTNGQPVAELTSRVSFLTSIALAANKSQIILGGWSGATVWDLQRGSVLQQFEHPYTIAPLSRQPYEGRWRVGKITAVGLLPDADVAITCGSDRLIIAWDTSSGTILKQVQFGSIIESMSISPDGTKLAVGGTYEAAVYQTSNLEMLHHWKDLKGQVTGIAFSSDGLRVLTCGLESIIWNVENGAEVQRLDLERFEIDYTNGVAAFSRDGTKCLTAFANVAICWAAESGEALQWLRGKTMATSHSEQDFRLHAGHTGQVTVAAFSNDGTRAFTGGSDGLVLEWNLTTAQVTGRFEGHRSDIADLVLTSDGTKLITASLDGSCCIWSLEDRSQLCTLIPFGTNDWAVVDPEGRFDVRNVEAGPFAWVFPDDPFRPLPAEVFMRQYFEPQLLARLHAGEEFSPVPPLGAFNRVQPHVRVLSVTPTDTANVVSVNVAVSGNSRTFHRGDNTVEMSTEAYDVRVFRDGQLVGQWPLSFNANDQTDSDFDPEAAVIAWRDATRIKADGSRVKEAADGELLISFPVRLPARDSESEIEIGAYAFNEDRIKSPTARVSYTAPPSEDFRKPRAYIVCMGVSASEQPKWNLSFAANDARLISTAVGESLARAGHFEVVPIVLTSEPGSTSPPTATKANLRAILELLAGHEQTQIRSRVPGTDRIRRAEPDDLLLFSFSGHGYTDSSGQLYLLPYDVGSDSSEVTGLLGRSISTLDLSNWLYEIDVGRCILILDACHSASAGAPPGFKPGPLGSRGLAQLAYDKGMQVLAASQAKEVALESEQLQHGLLTYALVQEGLIDRGAARLDQFTLDRLLNYAVSRVPGLYDDIVRGEVRDARGRDIIPIVSGELDSSAVQTPELFDFSSQRVRMPIILAR